MPQFTITDEFVDRLCDNGRFISKMKKIQENQLNEKGNDLTSSQCSQMETSYDCVEPQNLVQEISLALMENINKQIEQQLKQATELTQTLLQEVKEIKTSIKLEPLPSPLLNHQNHQFITKKDHQAWALDLINQINDCICGGLQQHNERFNSLQLKIDGKLQKNTKTLHDLHHMIEQKKIDTIKIQQKTPVLQQKSTSDKKKLQQNKSWTSIGKFFNLGSK